MWPKTRRADDADDTVEINEFLHDEGARRLSVALRDRDWPTAREILTGADPEHFMYYMEFAASADGVEEWIPDVIRAEPNSTLPVLVRGARAVYWAWDARGSGTSDTVTQEQWKIWFQRLKLAENCLDEVIDRDPGCAEAWHYLVVLGRARQLPMEERWHRFNKLIEIDPTHLFGHEQMLNNLMPKWSGSTEAMFDFARTRAAACPGTNVPLIVAQAHLEHRWSEGGKAYLRRPEVSGEICAAAHTSVWHDDYRRSLLTPVLWNHFAYSLSVGRLFRPANALFDEIGDEWVRTAPWRSVERFTELRDWSRGKDDDTGRDD
ncbi:hypothetical protein KZ829_00050 [Actinoplanes hulinensis]|uniref:DUF4034 domain-containing protein n=1 Tax=Actinoplanes hulinensis TaxID=1144547 RepID=A0ABS7ATJ8_9ACTN|nr:hypothetical protein [Actinoplanes hulinensis]MBW6432142.1 hypothetical protein [Actinoplanes hulinensis]